MTDSLNRARTIESQYRVAEDGPDVAQQPHALLAVGDTRGKQIHDANVVATMLAHGIRTLLTDNVGDSARRGHLIDVRAVAPVECLGLGPSITDEPDDETAQDFGRSGLGPSPIQVRITPTAP